MIAPRIFISHASQDAQFAGRLADDLGTAGADLWLDSSHMGAGDFVQRINEALQSVDVLVLVLTPAAIASPWVKQEVNAAIALEKAGLMRAPIVVVARPCRIKDIPPLWNVYHRFDAIGDYQSALSGVLRELYTPTPLTSFPRDESRDESQDESLETSAGSSPVYRFQIQNATFRMDMTPATTPQSVPAPSMPPTRTNVRSGCLIAYILGLVYFVWVTSMVSDGGIPWMLVLYVAGGLIVWGIVAASQHSGKPS